MGSNGEDKECNISVVRDEDGNKIDSRFALPIYDENGKVERYNVFHASMIIRHSADSRLYLYDIINIKKETSNPLSS